MKFVLPLSGVGHCMIDPFGVFFCIGADADLKLRSGAQEISPNLCSDNCGAQRGHNITVVNTEIMKIT